MPSLQEIISISKRSLGLNDKQAHIYSTLVREGFLSPSEIARLTNIKRTTVYLELVELKNIGLVSEKIKGKRKQIGIAEPKALRELIADEKEKIKKKETLIEEMVSLVESFEKKNNDNTEIELLEGKSGAIALIEKIIRQKEHIRWLGSLDDMVRIIGEEKFYKLMTWRRMDQKTTSYAITDRSILENKKFGEYIEGFRQFRFLEKKFSIPALFVIYGNTVALIRTEGKKEVKIVLIKDTKIKELMVFMFELLWNLLPEK